MEESSLSVQRSNFSSNTAQSRGGVVYATDISRLTVESSNFTSSSAGDYGGVVYAHGSSVAVIASDFTSNSAGEDGGVVSAERNCNVEVFASTFASNSAGESGGVIVAAWESHVLVKISCFSNNTGEWWGGVLWAYSSFIIVSSSHFTSNNAMFGGVVCSIESSSVTFDASYFTRNSAECAGGVVFADDTGVTVHTSFFTGNRAGRFGGVMGAWGRSSVAVHTSHFTLNNAQWGAGIYADGHVHVSPRPVFVLMSQCHVVKNVASLSGAGIMTFQTFVSLSETHFAENKGTSIFEGTEETNLDHKNTSIIENCTFKNNLQKPKAAADIFFSAPVLLSNLTMKQRWNKKDSYSVITLRTTEISSLNVVLDAGHPSIVVFIEILSWESKKNKAVHTICPKSTRPSVKMATITNKGVHGAKILCEPCPFGYFHGLKSVIFGLYKQDQAHMICKSEVFHNNPRHSIYMFCYSLEQQCSPCPEGADCSLEGNVVS